MGEQQEQAERDSLIEQLRAAPLSLKIIVPLGAVALSLLSAGVTVGVSYAGVPSKGYVDAAVQAGIAAHAGLPRTRNAPDKSAHPPYEVALSALEAASFANEQVLRERIRFEPAMMSQQVGVTAATFETTPRRRAEAARAAADAFDEAAEKLLDEYFDLPPEKREGFELTKKLAKAARRASGANLPRGLQY